MVFNRVVAATIGLAMLLAALTGAFAYSQLGLAARARHLVDHTHRVIEQNQSLLTLSQRAENTQRGYLLTHEPEYLVPFAATAREIPKAEADLVALTAENPDQAARVRALDALISRRLDVLTRSVRLARQGELDAARAEVFGPDGRRAAPEIRARSDAVSATERRLLEDRVRRADRADTTNLVIGLAVAGLALLGLVGAVFYLARGNARLIDALAEAERAEAKRAASDALTQAVFANSPDYLFVLEEADNDRFVVGEVNPAFEKAMNLSFDPCGKSMDDLALPDAAARLNAHCRRVLAASEPVVSRDRINDVPDGPRTWESILAPVKNPKGGRHRIVGSIRDITARVRTEQRLREAQRMEAVGQLTGGVAHDFNNLLQVIRGNLELLEPLLGDSETGRRRLANALHGADRAAQLTRQLLAFARRQPLAPQVVNLSRLVDDMTELLRRTLGEAVTVETRIADDLWNTLVDPAQVESAILNLAINARDAMPGGGRLTVELVNARPGPEAAQEAGRAETGDFVRLAVSDTGEGMSAETMAKVFEPFFTTKPDGKGSGLGLSMVYGFVRQSNGHVRLESSPGQGTTVSIFLPRSEAPVVEAVVPPRPVAAGRGQLILVVEDEAAVRAAAVAMLQGLGYRCLEAGDAAAALAMVRAGAKPALVFSDVVMPGPLDIRAFAQALGEEAPEAPILFTSGYADDAIVHDGRLDDGVQLLSKPYSRQDLARRVASLLPPAL